MVKKQKTLEDLCKQDMKKLAKKLNLSKERTKEFLEEGEPFEEILRRTLSNKDTQEILANNICFSSSGAVNRLTGAKIITFKFGTLEQAQMSFVADELHDQLSNIVKEGLKNSQKDSFDNKKITGRA